MPLPELDLARIRRWAEHKVPPQMLGQLRIEVDVTNTHVTIVECNPPWDPSMGTEWIRVPVARLRHVRSQGVWKLYHRDSNQRFHEYWDFEPSPHVQTLLDEIDSDPTGIFWG